MIYKFLLLSILFSFLASCTHINYIGKTYNPTENIDVYFSPTETEKEYEIMGHAISAGQIFVSVDDLRQKLLEEARVNGADAIIITAIDRDSEFDGAGYDAEKQVKATFIRYK